MWELPFHPKMGFPSNEILWAVEIDTFQTSH